MTFRGYFALDGVELANSSRTVAHLGRTAPINDLVLGGVAPPGTDCAPVPIAEGRLLFETPPSSVPIEPGRLLFTPADGSKLYGPAMLIRDECWRASALCGSCHSVIEYDDSWPGLREFLDDSLYRPELAPWYSTRSPESAEFGGVWVMDVTGLEAAPVERPITEAAGNGGVAGPHRDGTRKVTFDAVLVACTNAGLTYGLRWLTCQLRATNGRTDAVLRFLAAHPGHSAVDPEGLLREAHGVVLTKAPEIVEAQVGQRKQHQQATTYRVQWEMTVLHPYNYLPAVDIPVVWDTITVEPISWVHAGDCREPASCDDMPVLFSETCEPERIEIVNTPPPTCGGCMPVCAVEQAVFNVPTRDYALRCNETAVTTIVRNLGAHPLTAQFFWRGCNPDPSCDDTRWPLQVTGLPAGAELVLDGITGRYWANYGGRRRRPANIVNTPNGAPWRPPVIDRADCLEFVAIAPGNADFDVTLRLADREG
ncbi:minor tail protein [Mycobacterium phage Thonko]|uniref:Minor tail protein n=1 Tax=Mycobacterium phage Thonko TaxID=2282910 RepID=A0A346FC74_9CAUD|nr:minor tail protein [Mycobacterium phage Thonko]AXN53299.1 minor tail protein [Mycobacterium phage Thonko]